MSNPVQPTAFFYEDLDETAREFVLQKADETRALLRRTAQNVLAIGRNLQEIKDALPHGQFLAWLEAEFAMTERHARNFMHVAARFGSKPEIISDLSVTVIYELAAPSTPEVVINQVESKHILPTLEAIKAAKEAERQAREAEQHARAETQRAQQALSSLQEETHDQQNTIARLTRDITALQEHIAALSTEAVQIKEDEKLGVPAEIAAQLEALHQKVQELTRQRDALTQTVEKFAEEARAAALKRDENEQDRRIRLHWFRLTNAFQASLRSLLAEWPSPLDTQAFEASDWTRLAQIKALARRFLAECDVLTGGSDSIVVDGSSMSPEEVGKQQGEA
jgi:DNA repair exonuclease SbcCD ATPase subunit